jgi:hypothetical protein
VGAIRRDSTNRPLPFSLRGKRQGDCNLRYETTQNDRVRGGQFGEVPVRLVAGPAGSRGA